MPAPYDNGGNNRVNYIWLIVDSPDAPVRDSIAPGGVKDHIIEGLTQFKNSQGAVITGGVFDLNFIRPEDAINNHVENVSLSAVIIKTTIPGANIPDDDDPVAGSFDVLGTNADVDWNGAAVLAPGSQVVDDPTPAETELDFSDGDSPTRPWNIPAIVVPSGVSVAIRVTAAFDSAETAFDTDVMNYLAKATFTGSIGP